MEEKRRTGWGISGKKRNERNAAFIKLCADVCAPLLLRLRPPTPLPLSPIYIYIYTSFILFLDSTTRENNDSATYLLLPPSRYFSLFHRFELFASRTRGHYPFQAKSYSRMSTREKEREIYTWNRGLFPSLPLKLCFRTNSNRRRKREREGLFEKGSAKFS